MGFRKQGKFRGFKLHAAINQSVLPSRAIITPGKKYNGLILSKLIEDLEADYVLADAAYSSKRNFIAIKDIAAAPVIADNPRKKGKSRKVESNELLKTKRYVTEQFNRHVKIMFWTNVGLEQRGLISQSKRCNPRNLVKIVAETFTSCHV